MQMFIALQTFIAILVTSSVWAFPKSLIYDSNATLFLQGLHATEVQVVERSVFLNIINSPEISVESQTLNRGRLILVNDQFANIAQGIIKYRFDGFFENDYTLVVLQNNSQIPMHVSFAGEFKQGKNLLSSGSFSTNHGQMIFLSNGPVLYDEEFVLELGSTAVNHGSICVLGTNRHQAQFKIKAPQKPLSSWLAQKFTSAVALKNTGLVVLKNAALLQAAEFAQDACGCVVLGRNSQFMANTTFPMILQLIFFDPEDGKAELLVHSRHNKQSSRYTVINFPKGSIIRLDKDFEDVEFFDGRIEFLSEDGEGNVTIIFDGLEMLRQKFHYYDEDRILTYEDDAILDNSQHVRCRHIHKC